MSQAGCKVTGEIADSLTVGTTDLNGIVVIGIGRFHFQPYAVAYLQAGNDFLPSFEAHTYNFDRDNPAVNAGL